MKLLSYVSIVSSLLVLCEGQWTTSWTTAYPVGPGVNLKGKMVSLSQNSGMTFLQPEPYYQSATEAATRPPQTTTEWPEWTTEWTTGYYPTTTSPTRGVSVCLRFMADSNSFTLFKLSPRSPLSFAWSNPWYSLSWGYYSQVSLNPRISLWSSVRTQPWTSVCVVLDSYKRVVQVFQGGAMSIRKIMPSRMVWTGEPVLEMSNFDGQVTDLEVWDYPLEYREVFAYMQNYGSSGTVLSWSDIAFRYSGTVLVEDTYPQRMRQPISIRSEGEDLPIRSEQGRDQLRKYKKTRDGRRQRKRQMF